MFYQLYIHKVDMHLDDNLNDMDDHMVFFLSKDNDTQVVLYHKVREVLK